MFKSIQLLPAVILLVISTGCQGGIFTGPEKDPTRDPILLERARQAEEIKKKPPTEIPDNLILPPAENKNSANQENPTSPDEDTSLQDYAKAVSFEQPVSFSGPAIGEQYFCLTDCNVCPTSGEITITFLTDGTTKLGYYTDCYVYGINGCEKSFECMYEITGGYSRMMEVMSFATCSGSSSTQGKGTVNDETTSGSVTCSSDGEMNTTITWKDLKRI